jgi:hypothetical protein
MHRRRLSVLIAAAILLVGAMSAGRSTEPASAGAPQADQPPHWRVTRIDASDSVDTVTSMSAFGINPLTGVAQLFYYVINPVHDRLDTALNQPGGQNPCLDTAWACSTLSDDIAPGSLDYTSDGQLGMVGYRFNTNIYQGPTPDGPVSFAPVDVEEFSAPDSTATGIDSSLKFDANDRPHIAYYRYMPNPAIRYAEYVGSGGNCGAGAQLNKWQCDTIVATAEVMVPVVVELDFDAAGMPVIAYRNTAGGLALARRVGSGGNCGEGAQLNKWQCDLIEAAGSVHALHMRLSTCAQACSGDEASWIVYQDSASKTVRIAREVASGGNCGLGTNAGRWQCTTLDEIGDKSDYPATVGLDYSYAEHIPYIAYQDSDDQYNRVLKVAYPVTSGGNCGDGAWICQIVDNGRELTEQGGTITVQISPAGRVMIAYFDEYWDAHKIAEKMDYSIFMPLTVR